MKTLPWDREGEIRRVRTRLWHHLSAAAQEESGIRPDAAALLQLGESDIRLLAELHFLLSTEVEELLADIPRLVRRLATTTVAEEERSPERVRGSVNWGKTLSARMSTGLPHMYVTTPARRAYQTPENELLVSVLDSIVQRGRRLGVPDRPGIGHELAERIGESDAFRRRRMLAEIQRRPVTPRALARVRGGRHRRRYASAIAAHDRFQALVTRLEPEAIKQAIQERALVTRSNPTLFEITGTLDVIDALQSCGWTVAPLRLFGLPRALHLTAVRGAERLELWYQHVPAELAEGSAYVDTLRRHEFPARSTQPQRPDIVLRHTRESSEQRWILGEVKLGFTRRVEDSARAALADLLGYRRDFGAQLEAQQGAYGFGLAWGEELDPVESDEVVLCTPDRLAPAMEVLLANPN
jgi:hypothetical protein